MLLDVQNAKTKYSNVITKCIIHLQNTIISTNPTPLQISIKSKTHFTYQVIEIEIQNTYLHYQIDVNKALLS